MTMGTSRHSGNGGEARAAAQLTAGLAKIAPEADSEVAAKLLHYLELIAKWNKVYNLTAVRDMNEMVSAHLLDSLAVTPYVSADSLLDVGSGAGLPGIPLAVVNPELACTLIDSNQKKCAFMQQAVIELGLSRVEVVCARVENWTPLQRFEMVISRAYASLADFVQAAAGCCAPGGTLAAMKGVYPHEELEQLPAGYRVRDVIALKVPGLDAERHLVRMQAVH